MAWTGLVRAPDDGGGSALSDYSKTLATLELALDLVVNVQAGYSQAGPTVRRLLNQALFDQIRVRTPDLVLVGGSNVERMVELGGLEPPTSWVRSRRSPS